MAKLINPSYYEGPVNEGEKRLFNFLEIKLPDDYFLIPNVHITYKNPRNSVVETLEYDCIVVAPHALYHIENKDIKGYLEGNDYEWFINGKSRPNPLRSCSFKTKVLASKLKDEDPLFGKAWIVSVVSLSNPAMMDFSLTGDCSSLTFTVDKSLSVFLQEPGSAKSYENKIKDLQPRIVEYLSGKSNSQKTKAKKAFEDQYEISRIITQEEHFTDYLVKAKIEESQFYKRIREYSIDFVGLTKIEQKEKVDKIKNQYYALEKIGLNPYILPVQSLTDEVNGYYYEISDYLEETSLRASLINKTFSFQEKINIILNVGNALRVAHKAKVYHRDVCPANIFLANGFAYLGNFGKAIFVSANRNSYTVMPTISEVELSAYMPIELLDNDANEQTDIYSFGVTIYELLTNRLPFKSWKEFDQLGGEISDKLLPSFIDSSLPIWVDDLLIKMIQLRPENRIDSIEEVNNSIQFALQQGSTIGSKIEETPIVPAIISNEIKSGHKEGAYLFIEEIKSGGFSIVWKVKHTLQGKEMAMKVFNESAHIDNVTQEYEALKEISHKNIVKFLWNDRLSDGRFFTVMELLSGRDLSEYYKGDQRLRLDYVYQLGKELCEALTFLHSRKILHRDIKPQNIIWDKNERFVLIDFNVAVKEGYDKDHVGTDSYIPPDKWIDARKIDWDESCDTFALGITLYQLVCKKHPWRNNQPLSSTPPANPNGLNSDISDSLSVFLFKAIQPLAQDRFVSAAEMMIALSQIGAMGMYKPKMINVNERPVMSTEQFVTELNKLYSQSKHNNSGTRGLDDFSEMTYIETKLDTALKQTILDGNYKLIIITGNAGDGKTAFIQKIENTISKFPGSNLKQLSSKNGASFTISGLPFESNYDGSQDEQNKSNDEVLDEFFRPFVHIDDFNNSKEGRIIAINEGRLVEYLQHRKDSLQKLESTVDEYFYNDGTSELPNGILIINLNLRSVVGTTDENDISILRKQIREFVRTEYWNGCNECIAKEKCFIRMNVQTFNDYNAGEEIISRLEVLIKTIHLRRELHITMRDIRSFISFLLTRDYSCKDVQELATDAGKAFDILKLFYFNITDYESNDSGNNDRLIKLIRSIDIGLTSLPTLDRELFFTPIQMKDYVQFTSREGELISWLNRVKESQFAKSDEDKIESTKIFHRLLARFQYFEGQSKQQSKEKVFDYYLRIPYRSVSDFKKYVSNPIEESNLVIKQNLSKAIAILENCQNESLGTKNIVLSVGKKDPFCYSFRLFPINDFDLIEDKKPKLEKYLEYFPDKLIFRHKLDNKISLTISLDLYEMLFYIGKGFSPSLNDLKGRFVELQVFKNMLSNLPYREVVVTNNNKDYFTIKADEENIIEIQKAEIQCQ